MVLSCWRAMLLADCQAVKFGEHKTIFIMAINELTAFEFVGADVFSDNCEFSK